MSRLLHGCLAVTDNADKCLPLQVKGEQLLQEPLPRREISYFLVKMQNTSFSKRGEQPPNSEIRLGR